MCATPYTTMPSGNGWLKELMERLSIQMFVDLMHQYGVWHGLLAGLTALIRGAYESEGLSKALLDAALCSLIGLFAFHVAGTVETFTTNVTMQLVLAIVIGVIGTNLIITTVRESFSGAITHLNPLTWFKKAR